MEVWGSSVQVVSRKTQCLFINAFNNTPKILFTSIQLGWKQTILKQANEKICLLCVKKNHIPLIFFNPHSKTTLSTHLVKVHHWLAYYHTLHIFSFKSYSIVENWCFIVYWSWAGFNNKFLYHSPRCGGEAIPQTNVS